MMEAEKPFDEEHRQHAGQQPEHGPPDGVYEVRAGRGRGFDQRVRQHVQHADAEHHAGHEADGELHAAVRQLKPDRDHAADDRRDEDQYAVIGSRRWAWTSWQMIDAGGSAIAK